MIVASKTVLNQLRRDHFPRSRFIQAEDGISAADDHRRKLKSAFQPIVGANDGVVDGQHGLLRVTDDRGRAMAPEELFERCEDRASVGELDKLARTLHAVNYFTSAHDRSRLFMTIDPRILDDAPGDHRGYFDALLSRLDVPTSRIVVVVPGAALDDPVTFVRSIISYATRGYRVMATMRLADAHADLEHVFLADPHYVAIDATDLSSDGGGGRARQARATVASMRSRGMQVVARRIETEEQAQFAREMGFTHLQGRHIAGPKDPAARS